jgi:two-component system CheB/CheR fusion protein
VFGISVPLAEPVKDTQRAERAPSSAAPMVLSKPSEAGASILIIDDDTELVALLAQLLRDDGHGVIPTRDEAEALASLEQQLPDLIISDFRLAGPKDGLQLVQALRTRLLESQGRHVPAIMLTGDISIEALVRFAASDVVRLSKPVRLPELRTAIDSALQRKAIPQAGESKDRLVHVIDDDPVVLAELGQLLADAGLPARLHASSEAFRSAWQPEHAGVLLIDAFLPGESGLDLMRSLRATGGKTPVIMITGQGDVSMAVEAMKAGAMDFIEKPANGPDIVGCLRRALEQAEGNPQYNAERDSAAARLSRLTARQRTVMTMILDGHPNKNIAADLKLSQRTVEHHRAQIMQRTGCRSLPELARLAMIADPAAIPS